MVAGGTLDSQMGIFFALIQGLDRLYGEYARKNGLTYMSLLVLEAINDNPGCTQMKICEETNYPKQTVNMIVKSFLSKGWVELTEHPEDRRNKSVDLTSSGKVLVRDVIDPFWDCARETLQGIDEKDREVAFRVVSTFSEGFFKAAGKLPKHI